MPSITRSVSLDDIAAGRSAGCAPRATLASPACPLRSALQRWWRRLWMDDMTAYLDGASDLADLERRQRHWEQAGTTLASSWTWNR